VEAFNQLGLPLTIIGCGPTWERIRRGASRNITMLGQQSNSVVGEYMSRCKAFIYAAEEDFGITPVEAQAAGAPVIAFGKGGVKESVIHGETGIFFHEQTTDSLMRVVSDFEANNYTFDPQQLAGHAQQFSKQTFQTKIKRLVEKAWEQFSLYPNMNFDDVSF
jgi:glycosyltransferase involved in cell wall biosynthesis